MSFIKNYLRNRMGDKRLGDLLLLYKSSDIIMSKLDLEKVMKVWYTSKKDHRITLY
jgi:predicted RNA-binding protein with PUA-like domain